MDQKFNEADIVKCRYHPKRPISFVYCKQICPYSSRLVCSNCVKEYRIWDGIEEVKEVLKDPGVILRAKDQSEYGIYDLLNSYFNLLEQDPDEFITIFKRTIQQQIEKLERDLKEGIEKYKLFRAEIVKVQKQFYENFGYEKFKQTLKDILKVESYHFDTERNQLEETVQKFILQFKDQKNQKFQEALQTIQSFQQNFVLPKLLSDFQNDFQRNSLKSVELLSSQLSILGMFMRFSNICDPSYFFELIQRIKKNINVRPKVSLLFKGSEHGMTAEAFWGKCSNQGPTIVICKSKNGYVFGGYSPCKWNTNVNDYQKDDSETSFLFSYTRKEIYPILIADNAIYCYSEANYGPTFGAGHNLYIGADFQDGSSTMDNSYYSNQQYEIENQDTHLMGDSTPQLVEMEVFLIE